MIRFQCKHCGQKISVQQKFSGKKGRCPNCKNIIVVPTLGSKAPSSSPENSPYDLTLLDVPEKDKAVTQPSKDKYEQEKYIEEMYGDRVGRKTDEAEQTGERRLPWVIDIFLYPLSIPGLITLGIIIVLPLLIDISSGLLGPLGFFISLPGFVFIKIPIGLYLFWYLAECVRDSALGGVRAPETLGSAPGLAEMFWHTLKIVVCYIVFGGPPLFYFIYTNKIDAVYWALLSYAIFFFPMGLLAVITFDSFSALNPILIIGSIFSTFFQYCGLVLIFVIFALGITATNKIQMEGAGSYILGLLIYCGLLYFLLIFAHLLGRFYWRYQEKLNWDV